VKAANRKLDLQLKQQDKLENMRSVVKLHGQTTPWD
jgi:hypothetical protein